MTMIQKRRYWILFLIQSVAVFAALLLSWLLLFDFARPKAALFLLYTLALIVIRWVVMGFYKLTHGHWRHTGIGDLTDLVQSVLTGSLLYYSVLRVVCGVTEFPLSIYVLEGLITFLFLAGLRVIARMVLQARDLSSNAVRNPVLIIGAGSAAVQLLHALKETKFQAVGLLDDDASKRNLKLGGVPVLGPIDELSIFASRFSVSKVLIAIPSATGTEMSRIIDICMQSGLSFRAVPSLSDLVDGKVTISELRKVNLEDLLGRDAVQMESENVRVKLQRRVVMVTGAAGSIGSELCRQIVRYHPLKLICVDQAETPLFNLQQHTLSSVDLEIVYSVTDITDSERMRQLLIENKVGVIFHAAAYKHVPMTESNPYEGLQNNVFGLLDLVETAEECGCEDFLLISTDKAVNPRSLMGCTKRIGEMIVGARDSAQMRCVSVRFGNVLGSQGSVIPLFQEQIRTRHCVTVTHAQMTRFFMTITEAVSLVLQAFAVGEHGNILVLDMGEPVRILDLAKTLIRISGKKETEVQIQFTGMRPGEKLHEELFYSSEMRLPTPLPKVMRAQGIMPRWEAFSRRLQELQLISYRQDSELIRAKIKQIIPEYQWGPLITTAKRELSGEDYPVRGEEKQENLLSA
ncbi:MAG: nucleoside-diphosphate sugar epimerase/dehydratase [Terracidiphilus sp.]